MTVGNLRPAAIKKEYLKQEPQKRRTDVQTDVNGAQQN